MSIGTILQQVETNVLNFVHSEEAKVASWWHGFEPILESDFQKFVTAVEPIAINLVAALATSALSGPAKLATVAGGLIAAAEAQGVAATKTMADTLSQQIVASISAAKPK